MKYAATEAIAVAAICHAAGTPQSEHTRPAAHPIARQRVHIDWVSTSAIASKAAAMSHMIQISIAVRFVVDYYGYATKLLNIIRTCNILSPWIPDLGMICHATEVYGSWNLLIGKTDICLSFQSIPCQGFNCFK